VNIDSSSCRAHQHAAGVVDQIAPRALVALVGEALLRKHKPAWYECPPLPRTVVISDRLAPYAGQRSQQPRS
jgi:hypothetical protein